MDTDGTASRAVVMGNLLEAQAQAFMEVTTHPTLSLPGNRVAEISIASLICSLVQWVLSYRLPFRHTPPPDLILV